MKRDMNQWLTDMRTAEVKKALPVLSFPAIQLMGITVKDLISDSRTQAEGMKRVADRTDSAASVSLMDLSVEAEAFGSTIRFSDDEVPTVVGRVVTEKEEAESLLIPPVGRARTGIYIDAVRIAAELISDRPVLAGCIGPFSLTGRLMDVSEAMVNCYMEPDMVHSVLDKATAFLIRYIEEYKRAGADGIVMAEPLAGILSPDLIQEFSTDYVKKIVDAVQDESFILIYHNCGDNVIQLVNSILRSGSKAYHFGNAIKMEEILPLIPQDTIVMGNVDPAGQFRNGTPESVTAATKEIMEKCCGYPNFVISSGCDIPPVSSWENIGAFFEAVSQFYGEKNKG